VGTVVDVTAAHVPPNAWALKVSEPSGNALSCRTVEPTGPTRPACGSKHRD
jgi:hypothetical protein